MSSSLTLAPILMRPSRKLSSCILRTPLQTSFLLKASMSQYAAACNKSLHEGELGIFHGTRVNKGKRPGRG